MDLLGGPYNDVDASFFEQEKVYDLFENDNDPIVEPKKMIVEEAYEEDIGEENEEEEEEEEGDDTDEHDDADSEDAEVNEDEDQEEIYEDDGYKEAEIENNLTTQNPTSEFEYTPDLTFCPSLHLPCLCLRPAVDSESSPCPHSTPTLSPTPLPIPSLMAPCTRITAPTQILS